MFQSDLCSSVSLNGVLCGSHYNRSWIIHNTVSEALERLLFLRFSGEQHYELPDDLATLCSNPSRYTPSMNTKYDQVVKFSENQLRKESSDKLHSFG